MKIKMLTIALAVLLAGAAMGQEEPAPAETTQEAPAPEENPLAEAFTELKNVVDALNKLKINGYVQAQYTQDERSDDSLSNPTTTRNRDQFSVRRGRVKFTYQATKTSKLVIQPDLSSGSGVTLKDAYAEITEPWTPWKHTLTAGQFKWPFGHEIPFSSADREMPERTRVITTLFPGERDRGVQLSGVGLKGKFNYKVGIFNGSGTGRTDDINSDKDIVGRVGYSFGKVDVGASLYRGTDLVATSTVATGREFDKDRQGVDVQWVTPLPGLLVRGEYVTGKQPPAAGSTRASSFDVDGYYLTLVQNIGTKHQFVVRVDEYDGNTDVDDDAIRTLGGAYVFHWDSNSKITAAYEIPRNEANDPDDNLFTLRYQFKF